MSLLKNCVDRCSTSVYKLTTSTLKHSTRISLFNRSPHRPYHHSSLVGQLRIKQLRSSSPYLAPKNHPSILRHARSIFIQTEPTPNADALKFIPGRPVMKSGSREFLKGDDTRSSPLARSLLSVEGVKSVFFGPDFISINKESDVGWPTMKPEIYSLLMEFFSASDRPVVQEGPIEEESGPLDTRIHDDDSEVVAMIKELLDTRVRPAIQEDGGDLEYKGFNEETGVVQLMLKGSCRGCDSSAVTLKSGIERMLMHYVPEVQCVEQVQSEEEKMAEDEFAKFEARLRGGGKTVDI
ncbi:hypothetical protein PGT21_004585 [Puccinia graminis f. sp. tritici]|uniref:Scaffold protein Nfu/NifU N-terminal domain-containing protein n=1 Tax=Puccinia graminis f. sp. tritici TaxID=56615 RepID=A0A5B0Q1Q6_PUCGR|nr:hypothetical protein PGT21_004585 [Puccinia graminis f. sp. tritici]KAA1137256.1 hypothetical protein PGTUg99_013187 [Puccinia graminis f. sp. tritici]